MVLYTTVYFVRHGATADFEAERLQGQHRDDGLSRLGKAQIGWLAKGIAGLNITAIYSSDLVRATETAQILGQARGLVPCLESRLRELDFGEWEGATLPELRERYPQEAIEPYVVPYAVERYGGESITALIARTSAAWNAITQEYRGQNVLIVSHAHALSALIYTALDLPIGPVWRLGCDPGSLSTLLVRENGTAVLHRLNHTF
ncbi:MAG TPA: histidine phosphatase family protein [Aggregatilineales bacterium]|nr:histidine phosphatase family protein [Aggregatilineales bacterium]